MSSHFSEVIGMPNPLNMARDLLILYFCMMLYLLVIIESRRQFVPFRPMNFDVVTNSVFSLFQVIIESRRQYVPFSCFLIAPTLAGLYTFKFVICTLNALHMHIFLHIYTVWVHNEGTRYASFAIAHFLFYILVLRYTYDTCYNMNRAARNMKKSQYITSFKMSTSLFSECDIPIDYKHPLPVLNFCECERYYLPTEVAIHNKSDDCWVSYNDNVYDLTELCILWLGKREIEPVLAHAGKDISHWFDHHRNDIKYYVHPVTGVLVPYCPHGPIPDVSACVVPSTVWRPLNKCPWWLDEKYKLGKLTKNPRPCRIINVLTGTSCVITVCEEDTIQRIQERALIFNANGTSYAWKFEGKDLDLNLTLTENNISDERERFVACGLKEDYYIPSLLCYYIDVDDDNNCRQEINELR